jgi:hypothetical protein
MAIEMDWVYFWGWFLLVAVVAVATFIFVSSKELTPEQSAEIRRIMEETDHEV